MFDKNQSISSVFELDGELKKVTKQFNISTTDETKSIATACDEEGVDTEFFIEILSVFEGSSYFPQKQLSSFPVHVIIDYLQRTHRYFLNKQLPEIEQNIVSAFDGPLGQYLNDFFLKMKDELRDHIKKEEKELFPNLLKVNNEICVDRDFIKAYEQDHNDEVEDLILEVRKNIIACHDNVNDIFPYRVLLNQLEVFEKQLRVHALVEDEVLIPKVKLILEEK